MHLYIYLRAREQESKRERKHNARCCSAENMHKKEDYKHCFSIKVGFETATKKGGGLTTIVEGDVTHMNESCLTYVEGEGLRNRIG